MAQHAMEQAQALVGKSGGTVSGGVDPAAALARFMAMGPSPSVLQQLQNIQAGAGAKPRVPCRFFAEGRCHKMHNCPFSHDPEMFKPKTILEKIPEPCTYY